MKRIGRMARVRDGLVYDTDRATCIGRRVGADVEELLYRTARGQHFLVGKGGPGTRWAVVQDGMSVEAKNLVLLTKKAAAEWLAR